MDTVAKENLRGMDGQRNNKKIVLFVDTVSPFAYEAYWILRNNPIFSQCDIEYVPVSLTGIIEEVGSTPPMAVKNKGKWSNRQRLRWASLFDIPITPNVPVGFPHNTLEIQSALCVLPFLCDKNEAHEVLCKCLDAFYNLYWVEEKEISAPGVLEDVLRRVIGEEMLELVLREILGKGRASLQVNTARAVEEGAFGLPWMVCTNSSGKTEGFWGVDHLGIMVDFLGLERMDTKAWKTLI
ncbi:hypothetical protein SS1G_09579 [Sclerotinia sclerotiorum 1980 UF-70]|uniref:Glutathione S-transferase kappa n=2 Tax=Sclerotinia sclerotiorum (strain ATCC 18683 / 1980 / Ss-1) TaxID=665079 RepID=A7EW70_SCLS1|nr:hypothetical protein SS1G_09579 [Sclerotinia sclerotiorum 1980 UF-70]APA15612.1 hypothetical protein sscle_15g103820 [Sclerotinia sclerotiorum 1980 UF-70]EDN93712.1 hypothetical protein SS1G_09579 [Sclerotinia sclerotiorum 1980 UF-70]